MDQHALRLAEGKVLKLLYGLFDEADVLGVTDGDFHARFCPECDLGPVSARRLDREAVSALPFKESRATRDDFLESFVQACRTMNPLDAFLAGAMGLPW